MRRPNKPHKEGFEDEEDCEGYYDPDETDRRGCHPSWAARGRTPADPCRICCEDWRAKETARCQAEYDALSKNEKEQREKLLKGLRELY